MELDNWKCLIARESHDDVKTLTYLLYAMIYITVVVVLYALCLSTLDCRFLHQRSDQVIPRVPNHQLDNHCGTNLHHQSGRGLFLYLLLGICHRCISGKSSWSMVGVRVGSHY